MSKYLVILDHARQNAAVTVAGGSIPAGYTEVGSFQADIDPETNMVSGGTLTEHGEHIFVVEARKVLEKAEVTDFGSMMVTDMASNQPTGQDVPTIKEIEIENARALHGGVGAKDDPRVTQSIGGKEANPEASEFGQQGVDQSEETATKGTAKAKAPSTKK